jgi:hypothetical protein
MWKLVGRHPSAGTIVALLALFFALCGGAVSAAPNQQARRLPAHKPGAPAVKVVGDVHVINGKTRLTVGGDVAVHGDGKALPVTGAVGVQGPVNVQGSVGVTSPVQVNGAVGVTGGNVGISGAVDASPEHVLASGECNDNGNPVVKTVPNTSGLRITNLVVAQAYLNSGSARLSVFPPGAPVTDVPLTNVFAGDFTAYEDIPSYAVSLGSGLTSSASGNWTFRCGSVTSDTTGASSHIWMAIGH